VGRHLEQLTRLVRGKRILELGSGFGYSAYWFARGAGEDGEIILTDGSGENLELARGFLSRMKNPPRFRFERGDALEILDALEGPFDIVFTDIDKHRYPDACRKALPKIRAGGLLLADNALWSGDVADPSVRDRDTEGVRAFNRMTHKDPALLTTILPARDGLSVALKLR
jgi:predicted O-methyltransferase YrrM